MYAGRYQEYDCKGEFAFNCVREEGYNNCVSLSFKSEKFT